MKEVRQKIIHTKLFYFIKNSRKYKLTYSDIKQVSGFSGTKVDRGGNDFRETGYFWDDDYVHYFECLRASWIYMKIKTHQTEVR